jgi:hypothetical protein
MARDSAGTRTGVIGVATGGKYVVSSSSETVTGNEAFRWQDGNGATLSQLLAGGTWVVGGKSRIISSSGTPLDKVRAPIGSIFLRTDGGAGTSFYVKESGGSGSSGWVPGLTSNQRITLSNDVTGSGNGSTTTTVSSGTVPSAKAAISSHEVALVVAVWVAAFGAIAAAFIAIWQARFTVRVQTILQLDKSWASDSMRAARRKAAGSLLFGKPDANVDRVLDYFETIAGIYAKPHRLFRPSVPPDNWARHKFYWYAVCYWSKSREYIDAVRQRPTEGAAWENLCDLMPRWISAEGGPPTQKDIDDFIANERSA